MKFFVPLGVIGLIACIYGCVSHNIEDLRKAELPPTPLVCDSSVISFSEKIKPLLENQCGSRDNACHVTGIANGSVELDTYSGVKRAASSGKIKSAITWDGQTSRMPNGRSKLDDCTIYLITSWIDQGMLNN